MFCTDEKGNTVLSEDMAVNGKNNDEMVDFTPKTVQNVAAWSAEHPNLYTLLITLKDQNGNITEQNWQ